jgi:hypothetical protein
MDNLKKGDKALKLEVLPTELPRRYKYDLLKTYFTRVFFFVSVLVRGKYILYTYA